MRKIRFSASLLALVMTQIALPIISCTKNTSNDLTLSGGSTKIIIDQTNGNSSGFAPLRWVLKYKGEEVQNPNDYIWQKIGDDDPNISVSNGYISWNKPKLVNHTFRIRASKLLDDSGTIIEAFSDEISILADEKFKFEFKNNSSLNTTINAVAHKTGSQAGVWQLYLNNSPYYGAHSDFEIYDQFSNKVNGMKFDYNGQIVWDDSLIQCDKELYFFTKISERGILQDYIFISSNPINLHVANNWLNLTTSTATNVKIEQTKEYTDLLKWNLLNSKSENITESATTEWSIIDIPSSTGITINKGRISCSKDVPVGLHTFRIKVIDKTQTTETGEYRSLVSEPISIHCYTAISVYSPTTKIDGIVNKVTSCYLPWRIQSGSDILPATNFEIVDYDPALEGKISINRSLNGSMINDEWYYGYIKWDNFLDVGDYKFKVQATYRDRTYISEEITLSISLTEKIHIINNMPSVTLYKNDVTYDQSKNDQTGGTLEKAFYVAYDNEYLDLTDVEFEIKDAPEVLNIKFTTQGYYGSFTWDDLSKYSGSEFSIKLVAKYTKGQSLLTDEAIFKFEIKSNTGLVDLCDTSYNYYSSFHESSFYALNDLIMFDSHVPGAPGQGLSNYTNSEIQSGTYKLYFEPQTEYNKCGDFEGSDQWFKANDVYTKWFGQKVPYYSEAPLKSLDDCYNACSYNKRNEPILDKSKLTITFCSSNFNTIAGYDSCGIERRIYDEKVPNESSCSTAQYQTFAVTVTVPPKSKVGLDMNIDVQAEYSSNSKTHPHIFYFYSLLNQLDSTVSKTPTFISNFPPYDDTVVECVSSCEDNAGWNIDKIKINSSWNIKQKDNVWIKNCNRKQDLWFENKTSETQNISLLFGISIGFYRKSSYQNTWFSIPPSYQLSFSNQTISSLNSIK